MRRGGGGLVTALTGLATHRDAIVDRIGDESRRRCRVARGTAAKRSRSACPTPTGEYLVRLVESRPDGLRPLLQRSFANPMLWFIQHYLWDLSNAPDIRPEEVEAFEFGYERRQRGPRRAVVEEIEGNGEPGRDGPRLPPLHAARRDPQAPARTCSCTTSSTSRGRSRTLGGCCRRGSARRSTRESCSQRHHRLPHAGLQAELPAVLPGPDGPRGRLRARASCRPRTVARCGSAPIRCRSTPHATRAVAARERTRRQFEAELLRRRREFLILRVDRADLSKNVLRGFSAFDLFLEQHPEFSERVSFIAQLMPSRTDVPEYARVPRADRGAGRGRQPPPRHTGLDADPTEAARRPRGGGRRLPHYDVLLVNAMFDGMNLVAKEGPLRQRARRRLDPLREHRRARGAGRVRALGQPVRHPGARGLDPHRSRHGPRQSASAVTRACWRS